MIQSPQNSLCVPFSLRMICVAVTEILTPPREDVDMNDQTCSGSRRSASRIPDLK